MPWLKRTYRRKIQWTIHMICMPFPEAMEVEHHPLSIAGADLDHYQKALIGELFEVFM